jgi:tyrosyl-tRNA synthetase
MTLSEELQWRGLVKDKTFEDINWLNEPKTFYLGHDVGSADSLTIGNLAVLLMARRLLEAGWKTILLVGGATSLVGDPGGKDEERPLVSREQIEQNKAAIAQQVQRLFANKDFELVDNYDWFKDLSYLDFLREVGKHYSLTELIQRDFIADRIGEGGSGISYAEFSYSLIQGYDFWQLFKNHGAVLQIGGSDQWGNMLSGVPLIRKKEGAEAHALSMPLVINKLTGKKFGKSEEGAVWLDPAKTSPTQFYQFWINVEDANAADYLKVYTFLGKEEIEQIMEHHVSHPEERLAQTRLAEEVTKLVHGEHEMNRAKAATEILTGKRSLAEVDDSALEAVRLEIKSARLNPGSPLVEALVQTGLALSNSEARRLLAANAVYINNEPVNKENLEDVDFVNGRLLLRRGKAYKDSALIELQ